MPLDQAKTLARNILEVAESGKDQTGKSNTAEKADDNQIHKGPASVTWQG